MSLSAAVLDALLAAGCTADQIVAAVKADLAGQEARIADKRAKDAERQRKSRTNRKGHDASRDVTVTECDPPIDNSSLPPEVYPKEANASFAPRGRKPKSTRLPIDWQPEPLTGETLTMVSVWQPGRIEREIAKFRDYYAGATGRKALKNDWQAGYRNWLRNADDWNQGKQNDVGRNQGGNGGMGVTERAARQAMHEISGGTGSFEGCGNQIPASDVAGGHRTIDALPNPLRAIGYAGGRQDRVV